jgi:hypothetical protein
MKIGSIAFAATLAAVAAWPTLLSAESPSQDRQTITPASKETVPNIPGKSLVGLVVTYPPGGATPAHSHPSSAFVTGYVRSQARSEARSIMARRRYSTRANTGPNRPGPIIPSARTRAPLNLQVCLPSSRRHHRCRPPGHVAEIWRRHGIAISTAAASLAWFRQKAPPCWNPML